MLSSSRWQSTQIGIYAQLEWPEHQSSKKNKWFINCVKGLSQKTSHYSVVDAPINSKFLEFSQLHPYFHLVKSFFTFFFVISTKKLPSNFFFDLKNNNFLTKMVKIIFSHKYCHFLFQLCIQYALRNFLRCITYL